MLTVMRIETRLYHFCHRKWRVKTTGKVGNADESIRTFGSVFGCCIVSFSAWIHLATNKKLPSSDRHPAISTVWQYRSARFRDFLQLGACDQCGWLNGILPPQTGDST